MKKFCFVLFLSLLLTIISNGQNIQMSESEIQYMKETWDKVSLLEKTGKFLEAEKEIRRLANKYPEQDRVWLLLGMNLWKQKKTEEAIYAFKRSLSINPEKNASHLYLGFTLMHQKKDFEAAIPHLKKANELHIEDFKRRNLPLGAFNQHLAEALFGAKRFEEASIEYEQLVILKPEYLPYFARLILCFIELNRLPEAEKLLKQKIDDGNENYIVWRLYADTLAKQNKITESEEAYAKAKIICASCYQRDFHQL